MLLPILLRNHSTVGQIVPVTSLDVRRFKNKKYVKGDLTRLELFSLVESFVAARVFVILDITGVWRRED